LASVWHVQVGTCALRAASYVIQKCLFAVLKALSIHKYWFLQVLKTSIVSLKFFRLRRRSPSMWTYWLTTIPNTKQHFIYVSWILAHHQLVTNIGSTLMMTTHSFDKIDVFVACFWSLAIPVAFCFLYYIIE
jgi:hypothetical protein